jgi:hypothetical protein
MLSAQDDDDDDDYDDDDYDEEDLIKLGESLLMDTRSGLEEFEEILDKAILQSIKTKMETLAEALDSENEDQIGEALEDLYTTWEEVENSLEEE